MGCVSSLTASGPKSQSREDLLQWYKANSRRAAIISAGDTHVRLNGYDNDPHTDLREFQYLSQAVDLKFLMYSDDYNLHREKAKKKWKRPELAYAEFAKHAHHLNHLYMASIRMPSSCFVALFQNLAAPHKLEELTLMFCDIDDAVVDTLVSTRFTYLTRLTIQYRDGKPMNWAKLAASLPGLTNLYIPETTIDGQGLKAVLSLRKLTQLNISKCKQLKAVDLAEIPQHCPQLTALDISDCDIAGPFFRNMVTHPMPKLSKLALGDSGVETDTPQQQQDAAETIQAFVDMMAEYSDRMDLNVRRGGHYSKAHDMMKERARAVRALHR